MLFRIDFLKEYHEASKRDYHGRVTEHDKAACATIAKQWGQEYWDGPREFGYGGYHYDGRWLPLAQKIAEYYELKAGDRILDVGCGKAHLLYEFTVAVPGIEVAGFDISQYAIEHSKEEVRPFLHLGNCRELPFETNSFDFVYSINTLHNLEMSDLTSAIAEIQRVYRGNAWINVESWRTVREKINLLNWQLTCESFFRYDEWGRLYRQIGYTGDYGFVFFT